MKNQTQGQKACEIISYTIYKIIRDAIWSGRELCEYPWDLGRICGKENIQISIDGTNDNPTIQKIKSQEIALNDSFKINLSDELFADSEDESDTPATSGEPAAKPSEKAKASDLFGSSDDDSNGEKPKSKTTGTSGLFDDSDDEEPVEKGGADEPKPNTTSQDLFGDSDDDDDDSESPGKRKAEENPDESEPSSKKARVDNADE